MAQNKNTLLSHFSSVAGENKTIRSWQPWEKNLFRFFFIFFLLQIVPIDWKFYGQLFSIKWSKLHFHDLFLLTKYYPQLFASSEGPQFGLGSFLSFGVFALISAVGTLIWAKVEPQKKEYAILYYWLRVIIRFRLAFVLLTYGFIKFFPLQMPYPSLSNLLTNYGDFFAWKIYFQTVAIAPKYESFLGFVEILAAFLIFNRRTVTFGVGLIFGFLGNVAVANGFYDIGEQLLSTFIVVMAVFLFAFDIPRLYALMIKEAPAIANKFIPQFSDPWLRKVRTYSKAFFLLFALLFSYKAYDNFAHDPYKIPHTPGLSQAFGLYDVKTFVLNKDTIPYSKTNPDRWQDVVFEKWSTMTIKANRPVIIDKSSGEEVHEKDIDRNYELAGFAGRHYFYYEADTVKHTLALQNKNRNHRKEKLFLNYDRPNDSTIVLSGINENHDSIHVVLAKVNKKFMMLEGRRKPVKI